MTQANSFLLEIVPFWLLGNISLIDNHSPVTPVFNNTEFTQKLARRITALLNVDTFHSLLWPDDRPLEL